MSRHIRFLKSLMPAGEKGAKKVYSVLSWVPRHHEQLKHEQHRHLTFHALMLNGLLRSENMKKKIELRHGKQTGEEQQQQQNKFHSMSMSSIMSKQARKLHTTSTKSLTSTTTSRQFSTTPEPQRLPVTSWSSSEILLREAVSSFAKGVIGPRVRSMDESECMDPSVLRGLFEQGLMAVEVPEEMGGGGMSFTQSCIVIEELAKVDPSISVIVDIQNTLINTSFMKYGTPSQRSQYLPRLASTSLASFCLSESSSGSDAFALTTTAKYEAGTGEYILNGSKMWISNAAEADIFLVFANVDLSKGYKGITCFIVEKDAPGFKVGKKEKKCGLRASSTCELLLDNVRVSEKNILGKVGEGYKIAIGALNEGRIGIGAQMVGLAQGAVDIALPYILQRKQFGQPVAQFQGMQFGVAQAALDIASSRLLVYNGARLRDAGGSVHELVEAGAFAKLSASMTAQKVASACVDWCGGVGYTRDFGVEKFYRDSKIGTIYEGTTNLQLQTIAKNIYKEYEQK